MVGGWPPPEWAREADSGDLVLTWSRRASGPDDDGALPLLIVHDVVTVEDGRPVVQRDDVVVLVDGLTLDVVRARQLADGVLELLGVLDEEAAR